MSDFLQNMQFDPISVLSIIVSTVVALYVMHVQTYTPITKEIHEKLIAPIFFAIEPFLYTKTVPENINEIIQIIECNRYLADWELLEISQLMQTNPNEHFKDLCIYIDKMYDKSCLRLKIRKRSTFYRISKNQYLNKFHLAWLFIKISFNFMVGTLLALLFSICVFSLILAAMMSGNIISMLLGMLTLLVMFFIIFQIVKK